MPLGPASPLSQGRASEQLPEPHSKPASGFLLAAPRLASLEDNTRENGGFCIDLLTAGWSPSHSGWLAVFGGESPKRACGYEPVDGQVHTHKSMYILHTYTHWCTDVQKLTGLHVQWISSAGLCTTRCYTGVRVSSHTCPRLPWERAAGQRALSYGCLMLGWPDESLCLSLISPIPWTYSLVNLFSSTSAFLATPISIIFCNSFHPATVCYTEITHL